MEDEDVLVSFWPESVNYYMGSRGISWQETNPEMVIQSNKRYWFTIDSETVWTISQMKSWLEQNGDFINATYLRTSEDKYLQIYLYNPEVTE